MRGSGHAHPLGQLLKGCVKPALRDFLKLMRIRPELALYHGDKDDSPRVRVIRPQRVHWGPPGIGVRWHAGRRFVSWGTSIVGRSTKHRSADCALPAGSRRGARICRKVQAAKRPNAVAQAGRRTAEACGRSVERYRPNFTVMQCQTRRRMMSIRERAGMI